MFDPTAYENFKIIIEGSVYDADFTGDIKVINRSETIDLATLTRRFEIQFRLSDNDRTIGSIVVFATLNQIASEILDGDEENASAYVEMHFSSIFASKPLTDCVDHITSCLSEIWGEDRNYNTNLYQSYHNGVLQSQSYKSIVSFKRIITETMAEDLYLLVEYVIKSLEKLNKAQLSE